MGQGGEEKNSGNQETRCSCGLRLGLPSIVTALFLGLVAIAAAYLVGVMSGRHSGPTLAENIALAPSSGQDSIEQSAKTATSARPACNDHILTAEELEFAKVLRRDENTPLARIKVQPEKADSDKGQKIATTAPPPPQAEQATLKKALEADKSPETADYVFQAGAFRDEKSVDSLREKLEGHGLRTMMARDGKLFLVMVRLRGTAARAAEVVDLLMGLGLGEPILRSRAPLKP